MFIDALNLLSDAQAVAATAYSTNTIDLGSSTPKREIGGGEPLCLCITVDVAADFTTADETYTFAFVQSANANLSADDDLAVRAVSASGGAASLLAAGAMVVVPVPPGSVTKQYIGAQYTLGGTTPSITVTAFLTLQSMLQMFKAYSDGFNIS